MTSLSSGSESGPCNRPPFSRSWVAELAGRSALGSGWGAIATSPELAGALAAEGLRVRPDRFVFALGADLAGVGHALAEPHRQVGPGVAARRVVGPARAGIAA